MKLIIRGKYLFDLFEEADGLREKSKLIIAQLLKIVGIKKETTVKFKSGTFTFLAGTGEFGPFYEIFKTECYHLYMPQFMPHEGTTILDIGANIGCYSVYASKRNKTGVIYSFEPSPDTYKRLLKNISNNRITNVKAFNIGFWNKTAELKFKTTGNSTRNYISDDGEIVVNVDTLDNFTKRNDIKAIDMIKLDAEFAESEIIEGAPSTLRRSRNIVLEYHSELSKKKVTQMLIDSGFIKAAENDNLLFFSRNKS